MKSFTIFLESLSPADENRLALEITTEIDNAIGSIPTEISIDDRPKKSNSAKLGISQLMADKDRTKYAPLANDFISSHPDLENVSVPPARREKDYAFKHKDMDRIVYVNVRPDGKRSGAGDDPHELMTAALMLKSSITNPTDSDEMDALIEEVRGSLDKVKGYKQGQVDSLAGDYSNLAKAVSAAQAIHAAGYGGADMVYLTGQAWDDDVKQFQISKYGMNDFNSSDFIIRKGNKHLGVSLKKKIRLTETDPTLINKSFSTLFADKKFEKMMKDIDKKAGLFYLKVIARAKKKGELSDAILADMKKVRPDTKNWKQYVQRINNEIINAELRTSRSLFDPIAKSIIANKEMIGNQLVQLIFKADLKDLQKVDFDFTLVTGIGDYGPKKGVVIEKGEYKDIDTVSEKIENLASKGGVELDYTPGSVQAFEPGSTAAMLQFDLKLGGVVLCHIKLRYKGNFRSAPSFTAVMSDEFKNIYK